ncbi:MAG: cobalamin-dependent protein, partial [Candidatus Omnitrophota bacterium]|nr:cobalamin-dependent protein [Candidatus Omnitrophota bacterium]
MNKDIVFYQQYAVPYFGILSLSAHLKHAGISADVVIESLENNFLEKIKTVNPKLIGISVLSPEHNWLIKTSKKIKSILPNTKIIVGGIHAIFYPQEILNSASVDLVCHGDGENTLLAVMTELNNSKPNFASISGIAYKDKENKICINERANLVPFSKEIVEDRAIYYDKYPQLAKDAVH